MKNLFAFTFLCFFINSVNAQKNPEPWLNIGDTTPPLYVRAWLKGAPVHQFEKGKIYVIDFWATWCTSCLAAMPHTSALAHKYKDVTFIAMDIYEKRGVYRNQPVSIERLQKFVDSVGQRMDFRVATEDSNFMAVNWLDGFGVSENGIPRTFVINADGKVAWIGYPLALDSILPKIINNTWDAKEFAAQKKLNRYLAKLDDSINYKLNRFEGDATKKDFGHPDSILFTVNEMITKEPKLKYAPFIAFHTFSALLKTNPHEAYEYGKGAINAPSCVSWSSASDEIISAIDWYSDKLDLPKEIYELGAEIYEAAINNISSPELKDMPNLYNSMASYYWRAGDKSKAVEVEKKAIEEAKNRKGFSATDLVKYQSNLQKYEKA